MLNLTRDKFHYYVAILCVAASFIGMVSSEAILSISMITMTINALVSPERVKNLKYFFSSPQLWAVTIIFFVYLYSGLYSSNKDYWMGRMQIKLPFLFLPFAFVSLRSLSKVAFERLIAFFILVVFASAIGVFINYYLEIDEVRYTAGAVMVTPFSHVRYSLLVAFACFLCLYLYSKKFSWVSKNDYILIASMGCLLLLFLHVLAVRSGLLAFYVSIFFIAIRYVYIKKKWFAGIAFLCGFILAPVLSYLFLPTFQGKIRYANYSLERYFNTNQMNNLSDAQRIFSVEQGWKVCKQNLWVGVGAGDLYDVMLKAYKDYPYVDGSRRMPHNQWIWIWASTGLIGVLLCAFSFFYPLWVMRRSMNILFFSFIGIFHTSFLTEATIEEQLGTAFYTIFICLFIIYFSEHDD